MNKHLKSSGTSIDLTPTFDSPFEGYTDYNHPLTEMCRTNAFEETFQYVNESIHPICIVGANGIQMEINGGLKNLNRLVVVRKVTFGADVKVDLSAVQRTVGGVGAEIVSYVSNVIEREKGNHKRSFTQYYVVDTKNLWGEPEGVYLNQIGVLIYLPKHRHTVAMVNERRPISISELKDECERWGNSIQLIHVPSSQNNAKPVYMAIGNQLVEVAPTDIPELKPGLHLVTNGGVKIASHMGECKSTYVKPDDYAANGVYSSHQQLLEALGGKDRVAEAIALLKEIQKASEPSLGKQPPVSLLDEFTIGGHTLRECATTLGETLGVINKLKNDITNVTK